MNKKGLNQITARLEFHVPRVKSSVDTLHRFQFQKAWSTVPVCPVKPVMAPKQKSPVCDNVNGSRPGKF